MEEPPSTGSPAEPDPDAAATVAGFDWLALDEDESVLWADTPHEMSLVPAFVVGVPLSLALVGERVRRVVGDLSHLTCTACVPGVV